MDSGLNKKVVLITGASGGIGSEMVRCFAKEGARIAIHYHKNKKSAEALAAEISQDNNFCIVQADLTQETEVKRMWAEIESQLGPVQTLIANSGICIGYGKPFHEVTLEQWNKTLAGNLTSIFLCVREFFLGIQKHQLQSPSAVLIGSTAGQFGEAYNSAYSASKSPLNAGFLLTLKNELARLTPRGRINCICPSWTITEMVDTLMKNETHVKKVLQTVALRKVARPIDVAQAAVFLASEKLSGHCSGQVITLAGGMEGRLLYQPEDIDLQKA